MAEPTDVRELRERLRAIAEPRFSPLFPEEVAALHEAAAALERLEKLEADNKRLRRGLENALIHTARLPHAPRDLLEGLLASVTRICKAALSMDAASTPAPAPQQGRDG